MGITQNTFPALSRWALSYNLRSQIAAATRKMFALGLVDQGGNKPVISDILTRKIEATSWLVVDGQARVVALGKPSASGTFWRLG